MDRVRLELQRTSPCFRHFPRQRADFFMYHVVCKNLAYQCYEQLALIYRRDQWSRVHAAGEREFRLHYRVTKHERSMGLSTTCIFGPRCCFSHHTKSLTTWGTVPLHVLSPYVHRSLLAPSNLPEVISSRPQIELYTLAGVQAPLASLDQSPVTPRSIP